MNIVMAALNARFTHSSLALRAIRRHCADTPMVLKEYTINQDLHWIYGDLYALKADVYSFSCYIWNISRTLELCAMLKSVLPEAVIILGGPEAGKNAETMLEHPFVDYVICGEGEEATAKLLKVLAGQMHIQDCPGVAYRQNGAVVQNPPAALLYDRAFPYTDADMEALSGKLIYYESARGCPFRCSYCLSSLDKTVRFYDLEQVKQELAFFIRHRVKTVKFVDRTFNADKSRALELMRFLAAQKGETLFHFEVAADLFDEETLAFLATVPKGLFQFEIGIQSTNEKTLAAINRKTDLEKLFAAVRRLKQDGRCHLHVDLIVGLPYEDYASFRRSFNRVYSLQADMLQVGFLKLLHGTQIRQEAERFGYRYTEQPPYEILANDFLSADEVLALKRVEAVVERFYNSGSFRHTLAAVVGEDAFGFYEGLAAAYDDSTSHSKRELYDILYGVIGFSKELVFDFLLENGGLALPSWARREPLSKQWQNAFLMEKAEKLLPALQGLPLKERQKAVRIERFDGETYLVDYQTSTIHRIG